MRSVTLALTLSAALLSSACGGRSEETHAGVGIVREVDFEARRVVIDHEEIPGFLKAMTMGFDVSDPAMLEGLRRGQSVEFRVSYESGSYRISEIDPTVE